MITFSQLGNYGRFGNQLWQIASSIGIANRNLDNFALFNDWKYQNYFKHRLPIARPSYLYKLKEEKFSYTEYNLSRDINWDLEGYFQSWKYFDSCKSAIHYYFEFDRPKSDGVAIHIRRGDYLDRQNYHGLPSIGYYSDAMEMFNGEMFTIFSDDLDWCKHNFKGWNILYYHTSGDDIEDFKVLAGFDKFIIANSSYSWWAAYLSRSDKVVAPSKWFGIDGPKDYEDVYLPYWVRL